MRKNGLEVLLDRTQREALIRDWALAIHDICGFVAADEDLNAALRTLLDEILDAFVSESSPLQAGYKAGRDLALLACKRPEILGQTNAVLTQYLFADLQGSKQHALQPVLGSLLGGMAQGFFDETQSAVLTVRDQLEEARRAERRHYTTILNMVDALIMVVDAGGHIMGFNGASERVSGYSFDDVYGRHYTFLQAPESDLKTDAVFERLRSLSPEQRTFVTHQSIWVTRDGQRREIEWSMTAVSGQDGAMTFIIGTGSDVTAAHQMERELAEAHRQVAQVKEAERLRLAQDLHDDAVQQLLGISYQLAEMHRRAVETGTWSPAQRLEELAPGLEVIRGDIVGVSQGLRRLISSLRPPALREMGLAEILDTYVTEWHQGVGQEGPLVTLDTASLEKRRLPESVATCIFRLVQEGLWNAHKHAAATHVDVIVTADNDQVVIRIRDNGLGFRIPRHLFQFATAGRFGFIGMQERVHAVDGLLSIWSEPGRGTEVQAHIPLGMDL